MNKYRLLGPVPLFLTVQGVLWLRIVYLDTCRGGAGATLLRYVGVALCAALALYGACRGGGRLMAAALALTLAADTWLVLLDRSYLWGVCLFCGVQGLYLGKIARINGGRTLWPVRLGLSLGVLALLAALGQLDPLSGLSVVYFVNFACNAAQSWALPGERLFSLGLTLFLCCDACVGVFNRPALFPPALSAFAQTGMWLFYLPGQVLLALSGLSRSSR